MKLKIERLPDPSELKLDPKGIYDIGGFGVLMETHPRKRHIVKHCITGRLMDKRNMYPVGKDKRDNYYYLKIGEKLDGIELEQLIPSRFDELIGD